MYLPYVLLPVSYLPFFLYPLTNTPYTRTRADINQTHVPPSPTSTSTTASTTTLLWDRKAESGFPETKVLKQRLRDQIDPARDLGHSDVGGKKSKSKETESKNENEKKGDGVGETGPGTQGAKEGAEEAREEQEGKESVKDVRVDGKAERAAEEMVRDMQAEDVPEKTDVAEETDTSGGVKLNEDGSVCEDCR